MLASMRILPLWPEGNSDRKAEGRKKIEAATSKQQDAMPSVAVTDDKGRTLGMEDPLDPALIDDPAIFASGIPTISAPPISIAAKGQKSEKAATPMKSLADSKGQPYIDPRIYGGSNLDQASAEGGEPLNVIISSLSSPAVLTRKGLQSYLRSLDFDFECLGLHSGGPQKAWLDPRGYVDQNFLFREVYTPLDYVFGTCVESLAGGNHIRAWQQMGSGAWFFATSKEENVTKKHNIIPNGYDIGRDTLVQQSQSQKNGVTSFMFKRYQTKVEYVTGLLNAGSQGLNHSIATDGKVALLTVKLLSSDDKALLKAKQKALAQMQGTTTTATAGVTNKKQVSLVTPKTAKASSSPKQVEDEEEAQKSVPITISGSPAAAPSKINAPSDSRDSSAAAATISPLAPKKTKRLSFANLGRRSAVPAAS